MSDRDGKPEWRGWAGHLGRAIGRFVESEGGDSPETLNARGELHSAYMEWVAAGRPECDQEPAA